LRSWGRLWHQRGFKWEGKGHVSLDQQIQLTQAPWKERNLLSEAAGLSIHVHHHLENYQFRPHVDITLNSEPWAIQPMQINTYHPMWHDAKANYRTAVKQAAFLKQVTIYSSNINEHYSFNLVRQHQEVAEINPLTATACNTKLEHSGQPQMAVF
jgi:hypothetical protein